MVYVVVYGGLWVVYSQTEVVWENFKSSYHPDLLGRAAHAGFLH